MKYHIVVGKKERIYLENLTRQHRLREVRKVSHFYLLLFSLFPTLDLIFRFDLNFIFQEVAKVSRIDKGLYLTLNDVNEGWKDKV